MSGLFNCEMIYLTSSAVNQATLSTRAPVIL